MTKIITITIIIAVLKMLKCDENAKIIMSNCARKACTFTFKVHSELGDDFTMLGKYNVDFAKIMYASLNQ